MSLNNGSQASLPEPSLFAADSLWDFFAQGLSQSPESPALVCMHQPATHLSKLIRLSSLFAVSNTGTSDCLTWTYKTLHTAILHTASGLKAHGIESNTTLVTLLPSGVEWVITYWVAALLRLTFVPLDEDVLTPGRAPELDFYIQRLRPSVVFVSNTTQSTVWRDSSSRLGIPPGVVITATGSGSESLEDIASNLSPKEILQGPPDNSPDDPTRIAQILFTSGTSTGKPKGCPLTVGNLVHGQTFFYGHIHPSTRSITHSANFRGIANAQARGIAAAGACQIIPDTSNGTVTAIFEAIELQQASYVICIPAQVYAMTIDPSISSRNLGTLRTMSIGGDMVTKSTFLRASRAFPSAKILTVHGMTEGAGDLGWWSIPTSIPAFGEILAVGKVLPGSKIKICNEEGVVPLGLTGELHICSQKVICGYLDGVQSEMFYEDAEGKWMITGDRAMMNEDGFIFIVGRSKDIIMRSGIPIPPSLIESCLNSDNIEAQVIGVPSPLYGENPTAILNSLFGNTVQEFKIRVVEKLGKAYEIGDVFTLEELGLQGWPLNASGKVMKHVLKEAVARFPEEREIERSD